MRLILSIVLLSLFLNGCATLKPEADQDRSDLAKFAYANCLLWYFESKGYDTADIRAISGGIVETSDISLDIFQDIALAVKSYSPVIKTKNDIDPNLLKCFYLAGDEKLNEYLER